MSSGSFKNAIMKMFTNRIYSIYTFKEDLSLNIRQLFIYHKTQQTNRLTNQSKW